MQVNVKVSRASSWASLDSGAQLLQMALDKKAEALCKCGFARSLHPACLKHVCQVAQLEVLSENTPPGSEEWIQAGRQEVMHQHPNSRLAALVCPGCRLV